ncbi:hypothetical protein T548_0035 [Lactococcus phage phiL47]|uniref:Uncharacterized protein n=1 Tax=Lactococcus phage phiL47 TaxID=1412875 RepID=V9VEQ4_9CAUD|nr:hypothetical protein T548_0035 [Lactococcus phage phiL47]AHC94113.1 hypothetical protein T548_0035 [Lactococcus phage phiL47]
MNFNLLIMALIKQQELESGSMKYYYVKLRDKDIGSRGLASLFNGWEVYDGLDELNWFSREELTKLYDGDLYKECSCLPFTWLRSADELKEMLGWEYDEDSDVFIWTNPLIKLVEKED